MAKHPRTLGRAYLVGKLRERGLPRRQAVVVVNAILEHLIKALRRGEEVPFPFGKLKCVRRHFSEYWDIVDDWPANREGYTIKWQLDMAGARFLSSKASASEQQQGGRGGRIGVS